MYCRARSRQNECYGQSIGFRQNARTTLATFRTTSLIKPAAVDPLLSCIKESILLSTWREPHQHYSFTNIINYGACSIWSSCICRESSSRRSIRLQRYRSIWKDHWYCVLRLARRLCIWLQPGHVRPSVDHEFIHQSSKYFSHVAGTFLMKSCRHTAMLRELVLPKDC
jgi:hypothetical protein